MLGALPLVKRGAAIVVSHPAGIQGVFVCAVENKRESGAAWCVCVCVLRATV